MLRWLAWDGSRRHPSWLPEGGPRRNAQSGCQGNRVLAEIVRNVANGPVARHCVLAMSCIFTLVRRQGKRNTAIATDATGENRAAHQVFAADAVIA